MVTNSDRRANFSVLITLCILFYSNIHLMRAENVNSLLVQENYFPYEYGEDQSSSDSSEELQARSMGLSRSSTRIRYLFLDKYCDTLGSRKLSARFGYTKTFRDKRSILGENCWIEMETNGKVVGNLWKSNSVTKLLVHGWNPKFWEDADSLLIDQYIYAMGEEYGRQSESYNIIAVDWTHLSDVYYPKAASSTKHAGKAIANYLKTVQVQNDASSSKQFWEKLHIIGFSLGAHIGGVIGYYAQQDYNVRIGRITGLDPAGPKFDKPGGHWPDDVTKFLERSDATFVDIIHCNMGRPRHWIDAAISGYFGSWVQAGHADFYPNGGEKQSQHCSDIRDRTGCSHSLCLKFFLNSIRKYNYVGCPCASWLTYQLGLCRCKSNSRDGAIMGEKCRNSAKGMYYLSARK